MQKECYRCKQVKPLEGFNKNPRMKDGHLNLCRTCKNKSDAAYQVKNLERRRRKSRLEGMSPEWQAKQKARQETSRKKEINRAARDKWIANNPERYAAQQALASAVRYGRVVRQPCFVCGEIKVQGHHADYSRPLQVSWLCRKHHIETHCQARLLEAGASISSIAN